MKEKSIAFIGAGNMAGALIRGLLKDGHPAERIIAMDPDRRKLDAFSSESNINCTTDSSSAVSAADVVVLAVKPQVMADVAQQLAPAVRKYRPLVLSVAAGIRIEHLRHWLGDDCAIVRTMPNTPAMLQAGATGLFASDTVSDEQRSLAESIMRAAGITIWVEHEGLIDAVTAVSGSGPAYFFLFMEQMIRSAQSLGLGEEEATLLTLQTALGAARMALESDDSPATLRAKVTSPGGTTEQAIRVFEQEGLERILKQAMTAARDRSIELSSQLPVD
ncbi:MAG: pyrroline-5-carboxylate reductase [Gammaproteobacteria bacterium]|jgi:pyrroline-5-carboxylate reductase